MSFASDVSDAVDQLDEDMSRIVRKIAFDALGGLVKLTPVDTGYARGNWRVVTGPESGASVPKGEISNRSKSGSPPGAGRSTITGFKAGKGQAIYIFNNTEYINELDRGSSSQNRSGIVSPVMIAIRAALESGGSPRFSDVRSRGR